MVKTKIDIITPVHVGTGETKFAFEYHETNGKMYNYHTSDIFREIPTNILLDQKFLKSLTQLTNNRSTKVYLNTTLNRYVKYNSLTPQYELAMDMKDKNINYDFDRKSIAVQIKSLNKAFIPGSTIKGAIFNAIEYEFLRLTLCKSKISFQCNLQSIDDIYEELYPKKGEEINIKNFLNVLRSCLICRDISFDRMRLVAAKRLKITDNDKEIPLPHYETIDHSQTAIDNFIIIDKKKLDILKHKYCKEPYYNDLMKLFNYHNMQIACRNYFKDMIKEELDMNDQYQYYAKIGLENALKSLMKIDKGFYLRIGKNTNYFFKTISYLFKKYKPEYYEKYFNDMFTPVKEKPNRPHPTFDMMPVTRTYYYDDNYDYYPGIIKIEFINKN